MLGPQFAAASPARRPTTALNAAADSGSSSGGKAEATSGKPIRRRGPGRKTLAAARNIVPVPAATKAASYAIAQAASAGRAAAVEAMEREDADREALNVLAGEQRKELRASVAAGRGPSVLVSREGFEPVDQTPPQPQRRERPQRQPEPEPEPPQQELVEEEEEEEKEEEEEDEDDEDYDDEDEDEDEDDEDEDGEPRAKRKTKEELDKEEARQDALAANIQVSLVGWARGKSCSQPDCLRYSRCGSSLQKALGRCSLAMTVSFGRLTRLRLPLLLIVYGGRCSRL